MKIALAYPYDDHLPDAVITVDDEVGAQLIADGRARPVPAPEPARPARSTTKKEKS